MLEKKVKKSLIETKERKEKKIIEESLVKNRLSMLFEGINNEDDFNSLSESKKLKLSVKFIQEMSFLHNNGLIVEQDFSGLLKSIFGGAFESVAQTMVEPLVNSVLSGLGFKDGFVKNYVTSYLTSKPSEVIKSFSDCKLMSKLVSDAVVESMIMTMQRDNGYNGFGYDLIRNQLGKVLGGTEFSTGIQNGLSESVCSTMSKFTNNTKQVADKLKGGITNTAVS
jgi:hypothetical protein